MFSTDFIFRQQVDNQKYQAGFRPQNTNLTDNFKSYWKSKLDKYLTKPALIEFDLFCNHFHLKGFHFNTY